MIYSAVVIRSSFLKSYFYAFQGLRTERENTSNIQGTSPKQCDSAPGCAQSVRDKDLVPTPVSRPLLGQCKRKLLDSITEPPAAPSINVSVSDSVRRDFKRPRKLTTGCPQWKYLIKEVLLENSHRLKYHVEQAILKYHSLRTPLMTTRPQGVHSKINKKKTWCLTWTSWKKIKSDSEAPA